MTRTDSRRYVIGVDPGTTTGVAIWDRTDQSFHSVQVDMAGLYRLIDQHGSETAIAQVEKFTITAATLRKVRVYDPLDAIGYIRYAAFRDGFTVEYTKPADVMAPFPDVALKAAGWFNRGNQHANDAARHLAYRLVRDRVLDAGLFLKGHD